MGDESDLPASLVLDNQLGEVGIECLDTAVLFRLGSNGEERHLGFFLNL